MKDDSVEATELTPSNLEELARENWESQPPKEVVFASKEEKESMTRTITELASKDDSVDDEVRKELKDALPEDL